MTETDHLAAAPWQLAQSHDEDGVLRIALIGELDLPVARQLTKRLDELRLEGARVRLDLSRLVFVDVPGVHALIGATEHRDQNGERLFTVGRTTTPSVRRVVELTGAARILWPASGRS
jgi:anti-anti-sigma factor